MVSTIRRGRGSKRSSSWPLKLWASPRLAARALRRDDREALQVERVGADRFLIVGYEEFCRDPGAVVRRIADRTFDHQAWNDERWEALRPLHPSVSRKLSAQEFDRLKQALDLQGIPLHT